MESELEAIEEQEKTLVADNGEDQQVSELKCYLKSTEKQMLYSKHIEESREEGQLDTTVEVSKNISSIKGDGKEMLHSTWKETDSKEEGELDTSEELDDLHKTIMSLCADKQPEDKEAEDGEETEEEKLVNSILSEDLSFSSRSINLSPIKSVGDSDRTDDDDDGHSDAEQFSIFSPAMTNPVVNKTPFRARFPKYRHLAQSTPLTVKTIGSPKSDAMRKRGCEIEAKPLQTIEEVDSDIKDMSIDDLLAEVTTLCGGKFDPGEPKKPESDAAVSMNMNAEQVSQINLENIISNTMLNKEDNVDKNESVASSASESKEPGRFSGLQISRHTMVEEVEEDNDDDLSEDILGLDDYTYSEMSSDEIDEQTLLSDHEETVVCNKTISERAQPAGKVEEVDAKLPDDAISEKNEEPCSETEESEAESIPSANERVKNSDQNDKKETESSKWQDFIGAAVAKSFRVESGQSDSETASQKSTTDVDEFEFNASEDNSEITSFLEQEGFTVIDETDEDKSDRGYPSPRKGVRRVVSSKGQSPLARTKYLQKAESKTVDSNKSVDLRTIINNRNKTRESNIPTEEVQSLNKSVRNDSSLDSSIKTSDLTNHESVPMDICSMNMEKSILKTEDEIVVIHIKSDESDDERQLGESKPGITDETPIQSPQPSERTPLPSEGTPVPSPLSVSKIPLPSPLHLEKIPLPVEQTKKEVMSSVASTPHISAQPPMVTVAPIKQEKSESSVNLGMSREQTHFDYKAERDFLKIENPLMKEVMNRWNVQGIPNPDTNLTCATQYKNKYNSRRGRLEGFQICTLQQKENCDVRSPARKRQREDSYSNDINNLKSQLSEISRCSRSRIENLNWDERGELRKMHCHHGNRVRNLRLQQEMEARQLQARIMNPVVKQAQMIQLRIEHENQLDHLQSVLSSELESIKDHFRGKRISEEEKCSHRRDQLRSLIDQLTTNKMNQGNTDDRFGPHVTASLVKGPCRANNQTKSMVSVCLPADIATAILREDEVYDNFYRYK